MKYVINKILTLSFAFLVFLSFFQLKTLAINGFQSSSQISISAYDETSKQFLSGAGFEIISQTTLQPVLFNYSSGVYVSGYGGDSRIYTDGTGSCLISLPSGEYKVRYLENLEDYSPVSNDIPCSVGGYSDCNINFDFKSVSSSLRIYSYFEENIFSGNCEYKIYNENFEPVSFSLTESGYKYSPDSGSTTLRNQSEGRIDIYSLPFGEYTIESSSVSSYSCVSDHQTIHISDKPQEIEFEYEKQSSNLTLTVADSNMILQKGSSYSIYTPLGDLVGFNKISNVEYVYASDGEFTEIEFISEDAINIKNLPGLTYQIKENKPPEGCSPAEPFEINLVPGESNIINIKTQKSTGTLSITVKEEKTEDPVFEYNCIIFNENNVQLKFSKSETQINKYILDPEGKFDVLSTDVNGVIMVENLTPGKITIKNKDIPQGYINNNLNISKDIIPNNTSLCDIVVTKSSNSISVLNENDIPIMDVLVDVYNDDSQIVLSAKTNAKGKILLTTLSTGEYTYILSDFPDTYVDSGEVYKFSITSDGTSKDLTPVIIEKGKIQIQLSSKGELGNAIFALYNADNGEELTRSMSDSSGMVLFTNLDHGVYDVRQISAPVGGTVSKDTLNVVIDKSYKNNTVYNFETLSVITEKTDDENSDIKENKKPVVSTGTILIVILIILALIPVVIVFFAVVSCVKKNSKSKSNETVLQPEPSSNKGGDKD